MLRCEVLGYYIVENNTTIRKTALAFDMSKSTVHNDLQKKLPKVNRVLYADVQKVLKHNFCVRHIRGGMATKNMYNNMRVLRQK